MEYSPVYRDPPEDPPVRPPASWVRTAVGALLVLVGVEIILERVTGREFHLVFPALGLVLLAAWFRHDRFPFLVAGSLLLGSGLGMLAASVLGNSFAFADTAGLAWGFWLIQQLSGRRIGWARVGFLIALTVALVELAAAIGVGDAIGGLLGGAAAPLAVMSVGLLLVFRRRLTPQVFVIGVVVAASLGLTAFGGAIADAMDGFGTRQTVAVEITPLNGRTLAIEGRSADVVLKTGPKLSVTASVRGHRPEVDVDRGDDTVTVRAESEEWRWGGLDYLVVVPEGTNLRIELHSGDVVAEVAGDPDIEVTSHSGHVVARGFGERVVVKPGGGQFSYDGEDDTAVFVSTHSGSVVLTEAPPR
jgi:hypothetical protein